MGNKRNSERTVSGRQFSDRFQRLVGSFSKNLAGTETYMEGVKGLGGSERSNFHTSNANRQYAFFHQW